MKQYYQAPTQDYFDIFKDDLPEVVSLKLAELKPLVAERSATLLMAEEGMNMRKNWFWKEVYRLWVYEPAKEMFNKAYKELKRFYWLDKRLKGGIFADKITDEDIEQAKQIPIELFYEGKLKKSEKIAMGLCPFHIDTHNSFVIYLKQNRWYCFGACEEGGDSINFVMKQNNLDFINAVKFIISK